MKRLLGTPLVLASLTVLGSAAAAQDAVAEADPAASPLETEAAPAAAGASAQSQQADDQDETQSATDALMGEIVVTATKKSDAERLQDVPLSITAFGGPQLEALQFRSLATLTYSIPNVQFDGVGTLRATANFTIRGLGVNSGTPSVEPTVGTFVNGIYLGSNYGVILDTFDVESIEVLRGPQGVLFGRNVTGGAVAIRTRRPDGETRFNGRVTVESGPNVTLAASVEGALVDDVLFAKVTGYYNDDKGYFENLFTGRDDGQAETWFVRPTIVLEPSDTLSFTLIGEHMRLTGDGPIGRNPAHVRKFKTVINETGYSDLEVDSAVFETNWEVGPGNGTITNIAGYRRVEQRNLFDLDATSQNLAFTYAFFEQDQLSNELRYAARLFDTVDFVTGVYLFEQDMLYIERNLNPGLGLPPSEGGGQLDHSSIGVFVNTDTSITEALTLGLGARYSRDHKEAMIALRTLAASPCDVFTETCSSFPITDSSSFSSFTPRVTLKYEFAPDGQIYALYSKGYRSGGYNIRAQSVGGAAPFDDEVSNNFEVGLKVDLFDRLLRLNLGAYRNKIDNLQRDANFQTPTGVLNLLNNAADARIQGFEAEATLNPFDNFVLRGSVGVTDGKYTRVFSDINRDGVIDDVDLALKLPRLAPVTSSIGAFYDSSIAGFGTLGVRLTYDYRAASWFNDANTGRLPSFNNVGASVSLSPEGALEGLKFTIYGNNLLNDLNPNQRTPLPAGLGGGAITFPAKGRVFGVEVEGKF